MRRRNKLILEFTEFNAMRLNSDSAVMSMHVDDPSLSINAFDKHQNAIRDAISRLDGLMKNIYNSTGFKGLKAKLSLDNQNLQSLKILRIVNSNNVNYNIYISFNINDVEYWGVIKNVLDRDPEFNSEVFKDFDLLQTKEWVIKIKGLIVKTIKSWLRVENGKYRLINDNITCYSVETGRMVCIEQGTEIDVIRSYDNKIVIKYNNEYYNLLNNNFVYFNFWFEKL